MMDKAENEDWTKCQSHGVPLCKEDSVSKRTRLLDATVEGPTTTRIDVEITEEGDILFSGQDVGEAPERFWGDEDYEYWLKISATDKDRVLLALIEKLYSGNPSVISEIKDFLNSRDIPSEFSSYV
jgi:hypothetical protein